MTTPNIEALSLAELRYIADKQGVRGTGVLSREELVEILEELYEDGDARRDAEGMCVNSSMQQRFMNTLVEYSMQKLPAQLPGVQQLPASYAQTAIHLILKDPYWAHAYWSVAPNDIEFLEQEQKSYNFFLRVILYPTNPSSADGDSFDIKIGKQDVSWNVQLPILGRTYAVSLHYQGATGIHGMLCQSSPVTTFSPYWLNQPDLLQRDCQLFYLLFSSMVSKGGQIVDNPLVREILDVLDTNRST